MPYIAHSAVILHDDYRRYPKNVWQTVNTQDGIETRWRVTDEKKFEAIAGMFSDKKEAVKAAKRLYIAMTIQLLNRSILMDKASLSFYGSHLFHEENGDREEDLPDCLFIWDKHNIGGGLGINVYEADSIDEIDSRMSHISISLIQYCDHDDLTKIDLSKDYFDFSEDTYPLLNTLLIADNVMDEGLRMTLYCGILERLAGKGFKDDDVLQVIDELIEHVNNSDLSREKKEQLKNHLTNGREESARGRIKALCRKYAEKMYGGHKINDIIDNAYGLRSGFSHEGFIEHDYSSEAFHMKWLVLDVLCGYLKDYSNLKIEKGK